MMRTLCISSGSCYRGNVTFDTVRLLKERE